MICQLQLISLCAYILALVNASPVNIPASDAFLVMKLPGIDSIPADERPLMHAGHITVDEKTDTNYFFWKFVKQRSQFNRTIIWLNGGPGCSSMDGALMETGPLRVDSDHKLLLNDGSWYQAADMIFVDQPGGTGFSITKDYDTELIKVGTDFVTFIQNYFENFPGDANNEIYLAGESYAGQYIPFIADSILKSNSANQTQINLKGLLIGNAWIAPNIQSLSYIPYMLDTGMIKDNDEFMPKLLKDHEKCQQLINSGNSNDKFSISQCELILNRILQYTRDKDAPKDQQCINMYDTRLRDSYPSCGMNWPPDLANVQPYLQKKEVVESLNLDLKKVKAWRECDSDVSKHLKNKNSRPSQYLFPDLLQQLPIMLFNGDKDIICNNRGVLDFIGQLEWNGGKGFSDHTIRYDWRYDGSLTGDIQSDRNLTFVSITDSSHMVPFDKPRESRGLFDIFVGNFKIVETINSTYLETPVYTSSSLSDSKDDPEVSTKSSLPFVFYIGTVVSVGVFIFVFNRGREPKTPSILKTASSHRSKNKKTVSWADENDDFERGVKDHGGTFGTFLNNFQTGEPSYQRASSKEDPFDDGKDYENIELRSNIQRDADDFEFNIENEIESGDIADLKTSK